MASKLPEGMDHLGLTPQQRRAIKAMIHIPLEQCYLCADCEGVVNSAMQCVCRSRALSSLASMLNPQKAATPRAIHFSLGESTL